jgi:hypothetical protein
MLSQLWQQGYLVRVRWDPALMNYLVELIDSHALGANAMTSTHILAEEELPPWLAQHLSSTSLRPTAHRSDAGGSLALGRMVPALSDA